MPHRVRRLRRGPASVGRPFTRSLGGHLAPHRTPDRPDRTEYSGRDPATAKWQRRSGITRAEPPFGAAAVFGWHGPAVRPNCRSVPQDASRCHTGCCRVRLGRGTSPTMTVLCEQTTARNRPHPGSASDVLFVIVGPDPYRAFTHGRGWPLSHWQTWVTTNPRTQPVHPASTEPNVAGAQREPVR